MKVLVTGGAGFVGSHVVARLLDAGAAVRVVDLRPPDAVDPRVEVVQGDLADLGVAAAAVAGVDAVSHQAAKVGLGVDFGDAPGYVGANDVGTVTLLDALWRRSFRGRLVLAGSMVVYGEGRSCCPRHGRVTAAPRRPDDLAAGRFEPRCPMAACGAEVGWEAVDEAAPPDPRNVYAATKLHQEHLCAAWARETGATATILRYHNVYGPGMPRDTPYAGVASIFADAVACGEPPQVFEDGGQTRDFVHVRDVARANVLALTSERPLPGPFNVASGQPRTVLDMARAVAAAAGTGAPPPVVTGRWRAGDVRHVVAAPGRAAAELGFVAEVGFDEAVAELVGAAPGPA